MTCTKYWPRLISPQHSHLPKGRPAEKVFSASCCKSWTSEKVQNLFRSDGNEPPLGLIHMIFFPVGEHFSALSAVLKALYASASLSYAGQRLSTYFLNKFPRSSKFLNLSKDALAGERITTSPLCAFFAAVRTAASRSAHKVISGAPGR